MNAKLPPVKTVYVTEFKDAENVKGSNHMQISTGTKEMMKELLSGNKTTLTEGQAPVLIRESQVLVMGSNMQYQAYTADILSEAYCVTIAEDFNGDQCTDICGAALLVDESGHILSYRHALTHVTGEPLITSELRVFSTPDGLVEWLSENINFNQYIGELLDKAGIDPAVNGQAHLADALVIQDDNLKYTFPEGKKVSLPSTNFSTCCFDLDEREFFKFTFSPYGQINDPFSDL